MSELTISIVHTACPLSIEAKRTATYYYREAEKLGVREQRTREKMVATRAKNLSKKHPDEVIKFTIDDGFQNQTPFYFMGGKEIAPEDIPDMPLRYICAFLHTEIPHGIMHAVEDREWEINLATSSRLVLENKVAANTTQYRNGIMMIGDTVTGEFSYWTLMYGFTACRSTNYAINEWNRKRKHHNEQITRCLTTTTYCRLFRVHQYQYLFQFAKTMSDLDHDFAAIAKNAGEHAPIMEHLATLMNQMKAEFQAYVRQLNS